MPIDTSLPWGGNDRNESDLRARVAKQTINTLPDRRGSKTFNAA
jgi:hypothetical protein